MARRPSVGALLALAGALVALPSRASEAEFSPSRSTDLSALTQAVARHSPSTELDRLAVDAARADARQVRLWTNPTLDGSWGTIPLGTTNPPGLARWRQVPNYGVGLSYTFTLGKRGPRARMSDALVDAARANVVVGARAQALDLARTLGQMAVAELRVIGLKSQLEEQKAAISVAESRLATGFGTPLDVDRLRIERSRTEQQLIGNEGELRAAAATCAAAVGIPCQLFRDGDEARAFLTAWITRAREAKATPAERADVRALDAAGRAAVAEAEVAKAQRIPDPTVRLGYLYDTFVISGNQRQSLELSVSFPLPFFDSGQAARDAAEARRRRSSSVRERLLQAARLRTEALRATLEARERSHAVIVTETLPRARAVVGDLEKAATARLISVTDVIQARRTLSDLLIDEAETHGDAFAVAVDLLAESGADSPRDLP